MYWLMVGAQPTDTAKRILSYKGMLMKKHLQVGVNKGAITQEVADARFAEWLNSKEAKVSGKVDDVTAKKEATKKAAMAAEVKKNADRVAAIAVANAPVVEVPAVEEVAEIPAVVEAEAEQLAEVIAEPVAEIPAVIEAEPEVEQVVEVIAEPVAEIPAVVEAEVEQVAEVIAEPVAEIPAVVEAEVEQVVEVIAEPVAEVIEVAPAVEEVVAETAKPADDLKVIEGIGPKIAELLHEAGITTFSELAATPAEKVKEILTAAGSNFASHDPTTWGEQAKLAADGNWDELKELQDRLLGGRPEEAVVVSETVEA
jgi:small subunit ribosomal protein S16